MTLITFLSFLISLSHGQASITKEVQKCILQVVAKQKNIELTDSIQTPDIIFEKDADINLFNEEILTQWGYTLTNVTNVYIILKNKIYLIDDFAYYAKHGRFIEDSLAHEYVHFLQVRYQNNPIQLNETGFSELEAIDIQSWYRKTYSIPKLNPCTNN